MSESTRHSGGEEQRATPPGTSGRVAFQRRQRRRVPSRTRRRTTTLQNMRARARARGNSERNRGGARIFHSSCSRSPEIRPLWLPSYESPTDISLGSFSFFCSSLSVSLARSLARRLSVVFLLLAPLFPFTFSVRLNVASFQSALGFSIPLLRGAGPHWYAAAYTVASSSFLTDAPPRVAAVTRTHAHSAHVHSRCSKR